MNIKKIKRTVQKNLGKKIIGYFAIRSGTANILCDGDACVIAGSRQSMEDYIQTLTSDDLFIYTIKKTSFNEIMTGLRMGGPYSFDQNSYERFMPLAKSTGNPVAEFKFEKDQQPHSNAIPLMRVQWQPM